MNFDKNIIDKWHPYIEKYLKINNTYFEYVCCHYLEFLSSKNADIGVEIVSFQEKISNLTKYRNKIKDKHFNCLTGRIEYELENGKIVDPENFMFFLDIKDLLELFGVDFLNKFDLESSRDYKLNEILNEDRK